MTTWAEISPRLSKSQKLDYLRRVFRKDASFDPLRSLDDAWSLTESKTFTNVELEREGEAYNCTVVVDDTLIRNWYEATPQDAIIATVMKAYDAGVRAW